MNARSKLSAAFWMHGGTDKESGPLIDAFAAEVRAETAAQRDQARSVAVRLENENARLTDEAANLRRELAAAHTQLVETRSVIDAISRASTPEEGDDYEDALNAVDNVLNRYYKKHTPTVAARQTIDPRSFDSPAQRTAARMLNTARETDQ